MPDRTRPPATASPQTRGIPTTSRQHRNRAPDHQARYRPNQWTESGIARRNRDQSTPAPTMTHTADHNHTTNPRNTNNPSALPSSTITKPTTQNTRITDQIGEHRTKSEPVHTHAGPCPAANHGIIAEARNHRDLITPSQSTAGVPGTQNTRTTDQTGEHRPKTNPVRACADHGITPATRPTPQTRGIPTIRTHLRHQPSPNEPPRTPEPRTKPENGNRKPIQSTRAPTMTHTPATKPHHKPAQSQQSAGSTSIEQRRLTTDGSVPSAPNSRRQLRRQSARRGAGFGLFRVA